MQTIQKINLSQASDTTEQKQYVAKLYYHGRLEQQFSGDTLNQVLAELHLMVQSMRTGSSGRVWDSTQNKMIHACTYQATE